MKLSLKLNGNVKEFFNKKQIVIGNDNTCDICINNLDKNSFVKLIYVPKYDNYVLVNVSNNPEILCNNTNFSKVLVPSNCVITLPNKNKIQLSVEKDKIEVNEEVISMQSNTNNDIFNCDTERNRIKIIKEIGYKIQNLQNNISSAKMTYFFLHVAIFILSFVSSFGITNYLLGFKIDNTAATLNLTTNMGFLTCIGIIILAISFVFKQNVCSYLDAFARRNLGASVMPQKIMIFISSLFMFAAYILNLFYYSAIPGFAFASIFISFLFVGSLVAVAIASGYFKYQIQNDNQQLLNCEYREDFETVMKNYRNLVYRYINSLTPNRINSIKNLLVNNQLRMVIEVTAGIITSPFLAYGVSNTLANCFPEAANWVRIQGLRFSPIFLALATFLIIFAFFSFVRAFTVGKTIKASEIIKFDGFHDYNSHGVTILGLDSVKTLNKEKNITMLIACFIILIEFTMNVSYFITEIGGDLSGIFLSIVTALVPTALLIAETQLLSSTMFKINNYSELLSNLE